MRYKLENLTVSYSDPLGRQDIVLHNISLEINKNEIIGVLGESGSGKTQLTNALAKLNQFYGADFRADHQSFTIDDSILNLSIPEDLIKFKSTYISYIFQEAYGYFNPVKKIKHHFREFSINEEKILKMMDLLQLVDKERILNSYPHQLSGGQLQRLAIINTLIKQPSIIVADEIDSALDDTNAHLVMDLLFRYKEELRFALLWITHDQERAKDLCTRIWYLENGKIKFDVEARSFVSIPHMKIRRTGLASDEVLIEMVSVSKSYQRSGWWWKSIELSALKAANLKINKNEIVGLIGASGSGKSTVGRIIAGLETYDEGSIWITGKECKKIHPTKEIIYLFQDAYSALNPEHTAEEILLEALTIADSRLTISDLLKMGKLETSVLYKKANQISGGMRQRLALVRALALNPMLLILDESLNAMDEILKKEIVSLLIDHQTKTNMSILLISHQLPEVISLADRIYKIEKGSIQVYNLHTL